MISKNAASLRSGVIYSGAVSAAQSVKRPDNTKKASFFSFPGAKVAAAFITAAAVGTATYFFCLYLGRREPTNPPYVTGTETVETAVAPGTDTEPLTETDNAVTVPAETTAPETDETVTADETSVPPDTTDTETTAEHVTTTPETTEPETTASETTDCIHEFGEWEEISKGLITQPWTGKRICVKCGKVEIETFPARETKQDETTSDKPIPVEQVPPAPEDKNGYKLYVNHIDMTKLAYYGVYADGSTVLPLSSIVAFLEPGSSEIIDDNTVILKYEDDEFTLKIKERIMTGNHYSGNWFENKQTKTTVLYIADGSVLYADGETVSAFLSEFAGGALRVDKEKKTVTAKDAYYDEDTRHIPVLNESPSKFNKNGYKLYINGNKVDSVSFDVSGDGEATMPFAAVLNCLEHCEVKDFGSAVYIYYGKAVYELQALSYKLTGDGIDGNWFAGKNTLFMAFVVKNKTLYTDIGFLNDFLSDFAGGSATIDHDKKIIEIKDQYYKYPINDDPSVTAKYTYSDIFDTDVDHLAPQTGVRTLTGSMKFKDVVAAIGKPHGVWRDNDNYFMWCVKGGGRLYLKCEYGGDKEYASLLHKYSDMYDNGTLEPITELVNGRTIEDYVSSFGNAHSAEYVVQYGDDRSPDIQKGEKIDIDGEYYLYHLEQKSKQKNHSLIEGIKVTDAATQPPIRNKEPYTYTLNIEVIDAGFTLSQKTQNLDKNDRRIWICDGDGNRIDYVLTNNYGMASAQLYSGIYRLEFEETEDAAVIYEPEPFSICFRGNSQHMHAVRTDIPKDPNNQEHHLIRIFIYDKREFVPFDVNIIDMETNEPVPDHELIWEGGKYVSDENGKIHIEPIEIYTYKYLFKDNTDPYHPTAYKSNNVVFNFGGFKVDLKQQGYTDQTGVTVHVRDGDQTLYVSRGAEYRYEFEFVDDDNNPLPNVYIYVNGENSTLSDESGRIVYELPSEYAFEPEIASVPLGKYYFSIQYGMEGERYDNVYVKPLEIDLPKCSTRFIVQLHKEYYYAQNDPETPVGYDCCFRIIEQIQL